MRKGRSGYKHRIGNVIKILLRFEARWWVDKRTDLADLTFVLSDARIPVWWTQHPADLPVLTGWFGGPKTEAMANLGEHELIEAGLASLAEIFGFDPKHLVAARAVLSRIDGGAVFFSGEALYRGRDVGTVEAALASGLATARTLLG